MYDLTWIKAIVEFCDVDSEPCYGGGFVGGVGYTKIAFHSEDAAIEHYDENISRYDGGAVYSIEGKVIWPKEVE